jgi:glycosyltransferase involved in cell wall biosynthesis
LQGAKVATVAIIGSQGIPAQYGGFEVLAENLCKYLAKDHEITVYCSKPAYSEKRSEYLGAQLEYIPLKANGPSSIIYDLWSIFKAIRKADILLILGVSSCVFIPLIKLFSNKTFVINLDGLEWKRKKWSWPARQFLKLSEHVAVRHADVIISDNTVIHDYIKEKHNRESRFIAYGGDNALVELPVTNDSGLNVHSLLKTSSKSSALAPVSNIADYALTVCRAEPENNLDLLIEAFVEFQRFPLVIVGNWTDSRYGRSLKEKYSCHPNLILLDPIWDAGELFTLRCGASIYIHGHSAGGTNPSLVEAMSIGLPVFCYDVSFNRATTLNEAVYFENAEDLVRELQASHPGQLAELAGAMQVIAQESYTWGKIAGSYSELFSELGTDASTTVASINQAHPYRDHAGSAPLPEHRSKAAITSSE